MTPDSCDFLLTSLVTSAVLEYFSSVRCLNAGGPWGSLPLTVFSTYPFFSGNLIRHRSFEILPIGWWHSILSLAQMVCLTFQTYLSTSYTAHLGCLIGLLNLPWPEAVPLNFLLCQPLSHPHLQTVSGWLHQKLFETDLSCSLQPRKMPDHCKHSIYICTLGSWWRFFHWGEIVWVTSV